MNPTITRNPDGSYTVTCLIRGNLESQTYIGYTKSEAISLFRRRFGI